ncbi:hypothetical protein OJ997_01000 [Solirubrobacter phytolaccae]|uniref:PKD domain-containing protein n=1 Tax=Solirubrobacter phytolaccae TaxID=1404360 RepID=A0A9X3N6X1_9ACTN|nr:hypothetical protein [Solirubrobacter phytolaccae]MDA0178856.1 hypothetical protein [Solirubrobacter phytolaccae]
MFRLAAPLLAFASLLLPAASAHADAISVAVAPDPVVGVEFPITATWASASNGSPFVGVTVKPTGAGCAANFYADFKYGTEGGTGEDAIWTEITGPTGTETGGHQVAAPGSYTICAYLQDSERSKTPYALTGPVLFNVRAADAAPVPPPAPDPCPPARVALEQANQAATLAQTYVTRFRTAAKRYERLAKRADGVRRTRLERQAKLAKQRYRKAVQLRAKARTARSQAQALVAASCPA